MDRPVETHGFLKGLVCGVLVAGATALGLALAFPPVPSIPPALDPAAANGPSAPDAPRVPGTSPALGPGLAPAAPGPLLGDPGIEAGTPPSLTPVAPLEATDVP